MFINRIWPEVRAADSRKRCFMKLSACLLLIAFLFSSRTMGASKSGTVTMKMTSDGHYTNTVKVGKQKYVYHKIRVKSGGFLQFSAKSAHGSSGTGGLIGTLVRINADTDKYETYSGSSRYINLQKKEDAVFSVRKGTYYFRVSTAGMAGYVYKLNAVFTPKFSAAGTTKSEAVKLKKGKSCSGMFWFDGFTTSDSDSHEKYRWFRFRVKAGKKVRILYWSNYYAPDLYFQGIGKCVPETTLKKKNGKRWRVYTFVSTKDTWQYLCVVGFTHSGQEKMFTLQLK